MFITSKKTIRPSIDINFYSVTDEYRLYLTENYIKTGKILKSTSDLSSDGLTLITTTTWKDDLAYADYMQDSFCFSNYSEPNQHYNYKNNIISAVSINGGEFSKNLKKWKKYDSKKYFSNINIPDDWSSLEEFVDWYMEQKIPLMVPWDAEVIRSDDAVAICVFRKGHYQVEFYLEYPNMYIRPHAHPRMEVITMDLGGGKFGPADTNGLSNIWGQASEKLPAGDFHGGDATTIATKGFVTLAFQRWDNPEEMTSAAIQWKGGLQGPIQAKLIKEHKPNAEVKLDYADVTLDTSVNKY